MIRKRKMSEMWGRKQKWGCRRRWDSAGVGSKRFPSLFPIWKTGLSLQKCLIFVFDIFLFRLIFCSIKVGTIVWRDRRRINFDSVIAIFQIELSSFAFWKNSLWCNQGFVLTFFLVRKELWMLSRSTSNAHTEHAHDLRSYFLRTSSFDYTIRWLARRRRTTNRPSLFQAKQNCSSSIDWTWRDCTDKFHCSTTIGCSPRRDRLDTF